MAVNQLRPITSYFALYYLQNPGAAFSFLAHMGGMQVWLFAGLSIIISASIMFYLLFMHIPTKTQAVALAMILGGAVGNLIDRLRFHYVRDFLFFHVGPYSWPAFNVADTAVCLGAILFIFCIIFPAKR